MCVLSNTLEGFYTGKVLSLKVERCLKLIKSFHIRIEFLIFYREKHKKNHKIISIHKLFQIVVPVAGLIFCFDNYLRYSNDGPFHLIISEH